jgi:seryl-tRNA synthetase
MHDIRLIRENPKPLTRQWPSSRARPAAQAILSADADRRDLLTRMQEAQARRNEASKAIGAAMGKGDKDTAEALKAEVASLKDALPAMEEDERRLTGELNAVLAALPNRPADDVPAGEDESANVEVLRWGTRANSPSPARTCRHRPGAGSRFRNRCPHLGRALHVPARTDGPPPPRARAVHAGFPDRHQRLYRMRDPADGSR